MKPFSLAVSLAIVAMLALAPPALAADPPTLEAVGNGSVERSPDRVTVSLVVETDAPDAAGATSANNARIGALNARLRALGLSGPAVRTTGYHLTYNPRPAQPNPQFAQRYGFIVTRSLRVTSDRTEQAGAIVDAAVAAGVGGIGPIEFGLRDRDAADRAALAAAVASADAQARALAAAAHLRIVRIQRLVPGAPAPSGPRPLMLSRAAAGAAVPTEVPAGDLDVRASVTITYVVAN